MTTVLDPKLDNVKQQIESAFASGAASGGKDFSPGTALVSDASSMAGAMLSAYQIAATVNPSKAFKSKGYTPQAQVSDPAELGQKAWWDSVLNIIQTVAPVVINALSKDFQPQSPNLAAIIANLPEERRTDKAFVDYATTVLLTLGQATAQSMAGQKDFTDPANSVTIPTAPSGMDKGWFDDVCSFVSHAAPVVLPIVMSLI